MQRAYVHADAPSVQLIVHDSRAVICAIAPRCTDDRVAFYKERRELRRRYAYAKHELWRHVRFGRRALAAQELVRYLSSLICDDAPRIVPRRPCPRANDCVSAVSSVGSIE